MNIFGMFNMVLFLAYRRQKLQMCEIETTATCFYIAMTNTDVFLAYRRRKKVQLCLLKLAEHEVQNSIPPSDEVLRLFLGS